MLQQLFHSAGHLIELPSVPNIYLWIPTLFLLAGTWLVTRILSLKPQNWSRRLVAILMLLLIARYVAWRIFATLNLASPLASILSIGLLVAELLGLAGSVIQLVLLLKVQDNFAGSWGDRRTQADMYGADVYAGYYLPSVDVLIPTYNEPAFILRRTIIGAQSMAYPRYRVYLLDDTCRPEIKDLAAELGCEYISRSDGRYAKAGNLNNAIAQTNSELIVCFDADFIPTRNFLQRTVGFFQNSEIALLQTPQSFYNPDPIARNLGLENILTPDEEVFYRQIQPIRDAVGSVVCAGTSFVLRRQAIEEIGGFVTDSLSEDYFTAIRLAAQGYQVAYLNEKLSAGLAAENIAAHATQRLRWARGTLQAFFISSNPLTIPGLSWIQRLGHLEGILHWFTSFSRVYFLLMPLAYTVLGIAPIQTTGPELLYFFVPFYVTQLMVFAWLNGHSRSAFLADIYALVLAFPLMITVCQAMLRPFSQKFQVTPKGLATDRFVFNWHLAWPLLLLFGFNAYSLWYTIFVDPHLGLKLHWVWSTYNLIMLAISLLILIDVPRPDTYEYFALTCPVNILLKDRIYSGSTTMLSEVGCFVRLNSEIFPLQSSELITVEIPETGLSINGIMIDPQPEQQNIQIQFEPLSLRQQRQLIPLLYCRPGQWRHARSPGEWKSLWLLGKILLRPQIFTRQRQRKALLVGQGR
jgi:cellulose synthase (UDP-forming)